MKGYLAMNEKTKNIVGIALKATSLQPGGTIDVPSHICAESVASALTAGGHPFEVLKNGETIISVGRKGVATNPEEMAQERIVRFLRKGPTQHGKLRQCVLSKKVRSIDFENALFVLLQKGSVSMKTGERGGQTFSLA